MWLWLLIPTVIYVFWCLYTKKQNNPWLKVCDPHLLPALIHVDKPANRALSTASLALMFMLTIIALAGPAWHKTKTPIYRDVDSLSIILDLSPNMQNEDIKPNRLFRAKLKIRDLIRNVQNVEVGLVVFSGDGFVVSPISQDAKTLDVLIDELNPSMMPVAGTDITDGVAEGLNLLTQVNATQGDIVLLTATAPTSQTFKLAKQVASSGHHLHVIAMMADNQQTSEVIKMLQVLAQDGQGSFHLFNAQSQDIESILQNSVKHNIERTGIAQTTIWQDGGTWVCLLLLPLALIILRDKSL